MICYPRHRSNDTNFKDRVTKEERVVKVMCIHMLVSIRVDKSTHKDGLRCGPSSCLKFHITVL